LFEAGRLAGALGLDAGLGDAQAAVEVGEGALQPAQGLRGAALCRSEALADLGEQLGPGAGAGDLLDRVHALAQFVDAGALALLDVVEATGQGAEGGLDLAEGLGGLRPDLVLEPAEATMALAQLLGDVVDAALPGAARLVLAVEAADKAGDGLVDALDGDGRAALGGLEPAGDGVDGSAQPLPRLLAGTVGVIDAAAAAAALETV